MTHCGLNERNGLNREVWDKTPIPCLEEGYFFFTFGVTPRMVALGTEACFIKALGLIPTMCLNCLEKW